MTKKTTYHTPSLFEPQSRGGDTAEGGFSFQEQYVLSRVPIWLAHNGFTLMIREAMGDTEAKFFVPGHSFQIEFIEAKNHLVTPSEFWAEIGRFQEIDNGSPGDYRWFTLASVGISDSLRPLVNGLRRIRLPYGFYEDSSAIRENSFKDYVAVVTKLGHSTRDAQFLFEKVLIEPDFALAQNYGEALFSQSLADYQPEYGNVSLKTLHDMYTNVGEFVKRSGIKPIVRKELEAVFRQSIPAEQLPPLMPVHIHTMSNKDDLENPFSLRFDWTVFFGGAKRNYPPAQKWNQILLNDLFQTRDWILEHRNTRQIRLTGSRRLSAMLAIGTVFSAVGGFSVDMNHRNKSWATNAHPTTDTPSYPLEVEFKEGTEHGLVVTIGVGRDIFVEVGKALTDLNLNGNFWLHIRGVQSIISPEHANVMVHEIKDVIKKHLSQIECKQAHLFYAGPSHLALFLAHRLNATMPVQCYEWVSTNLYVPTCSLSC